MNINISANTSYYATLTSINLGCALGGESSPTWVILLNLIAGLFCGVILVHSLIKDLKK